MRRIAAILVALAFTLAPLPLAANAPISVRIDGVPVHFPDAQPTIVDGRTLVPISGVFQALGFAVDWYAPAQRVTLTRDSTRYTITIGSIAFMSDNLTLVLDVPAQIIDGRTMLPLSGLLRGLGYIVSWHEPTRTVHIVTTHLMEPGEPLPMPVALPDMPPVLPAIQP